MARKPKNRPTAASEKLTGKPITMKTTSPANMSGAIHASGMKFTGGDTPSLQRPLVVQVRLHVAGLHRDALDQLRDALQRQQGEADRQEDLHRPAQQAAGIGGD